MQEIGGYLELERFGGKEYHQGAAAFNTANHALIWLLGQKKVCRLWLPDYLCCSVYDTVAALKDCEIRQYEIDDQLRPVFVGQPIEPMDMVYLVNYYGQLPMSFVKRLKKEFSNLILDNVQAFFEEPVPDVDTIYSCRKWFGVPDGAYLYAGGLQSEQLPPARVADHFLHLLGRFEESASAWYGEYQKAEARLEQSPVCGMSALAQNILRAVDYEEVAKRRTDNFSFLHDQLKDENQLNLRIPFGAFMYPFCLDETRARRVRQRLIENRIYVPVLWPNLRGKAKELAERILPLPVDQRYTQKEMDKIVKILKR